ncbi:MAG: NAD(P)-dependent oxidoreductase [Bdellovibrionales bacterium]|nr:NAD(P)-dependent oxidoreductase [Bdellovibrionales bacterium]
MSSNQKFKNKIVIITGANGFIGRNLVSSLSKSRTSNWTIRALVKNIAHEPVLKSIGAHSVYECHLPDKIDLNCFNTDKDSEISAVIHCAHSTNSKRSNYDNVTGTHKLYELTKRHSEAQFILMSSLAAHEGATSQYGKCKLLLEDKMNLSQDVIIKPGTVVGHGGLFLRIKNLMSRMPIVPVFFSKAHGLQFIAIDDLCAAVENILITKKIGQFIVAHPDPTKPIEFYRILQKYLKTKNYIIKAPGELALLATVSAERLGINLPISSDNLRGLRDARTFNSTDDLKRLGIEPQSLEEALKKSSF